MYARRVKRVECYIHLFVIFLVVVWEIARTRRPSQKRRTRPPFLKLRGRTMLCAFWACSSSSRRSCRTSLLNELKWESGRHTTRRSTWQREKRDGFFAKRPAATIFTQSFLLGVFHQAYHHLSLRRLDSSTTTPSDNEQKTGKPHDARLTYSHDLLILDRVVKS